MHQFWKVSLLCALWLSPASAHAEAAVAASCDCPKLSCDSECEIEQKVDFYSEKCPGGKVRSCARPTCVKVDPYPKQCPAKMANLNAPKKVGVVEDLQGQAWKIEDKNKKIPLELGVFVNEKDVIATGKASRIEIAFDDGNIISLSENSKVELSKVLKAPEESKKSALLKLLHGKIRSQVEKDIEDGTVRQPSHISKGGDYKFRVQTPTAVAGVRGTDFVVSYDEKDNASESLTQVSTFNGLVELQGKNKTEKSVVAGNETGSYVQKADKSFLTPVRSMSEDESEKLKSEMLIARLSSKRRSIASDVPAVCEAPKAGVRECSWVCKNNPKGEKSCRTDLAGVECVRRVCHADGQWQDQTRLPASYGGFCDPVEPTVGPCDY